MYSQFASPLAHKIKRRLLSAARHLGTADPVQPVDDLLNRTFIYPDGDPRYARNALTPMAAPFEPSFSEDQPGKLRFTIEPLPPEASGFDRRNEATREMRRLIPQFVGREALYWFDRASENYRGIAGGRALNYGAFFGSSYDNNGLYASKVYYEMPQGRGSIEGLPLSLLRIVTTVLHLMPGLVPLFTTIAAQRDMGDQRLTFACTQAFKLRDLQPVLDELGLGGRLPGIMQIIGLVLGGRFELPEHSALIALGHGPGGPSFEIYLLLTAIPDVPPSFLSLLTMGLAERPKGLRALERWMNAFTPEDQHWPGRFSIVSLRTDRLKPPCISLYLRPVEFEMQRDLQNAA